MRLGTQVSFFSWPGAPGSIAPTFARLARHSDEVGLASLWVMDHFFQISMIGPPELDMLEGYTALAFAAGQTKRIELGTMVTGVTYRHPGALIKTVTTLDVLSGGRAWLGIGAAWYEEEHAGLGIPYPPVRERFERLEETLRICRQMFDGNEAPVEGRHYRLARPLNQPAPLHRIPILVGGGGEKKTLRLDGWILPPKLIDLDGDRGIDLFDCVTPTRHVVLEQQRLAVPAPRGFGLA